MTQDDDDRLRVEAAQSNPARFDELYQRNFHRVYAYVVRRVGDRSQAEDRGLVDPFGFQWFPATHIKNLG